MGHETTRSRIQTLVCFLILALGKTIGAQVMVVDSVKISASSIGASFPQGVAYHPGRNTLFILDEDGTITELDRFGKRIRSFFSPVVSGGGGIAYDPSTDGLLLAGGFRIYRVAAGGGSPSLLLDLTGSGVVFSIQGVSVHNQTHNIWIADDNAEKIMEFNRSGALISSFSTRNVLPGLVEPAGLGFLGNDLLIVDDFDGTSALYLVSTSGSLIQTIADTSSFGIRDPEGVAVIEGDSIWIAGDNDDALLSLTIGGPARPHNLYFAQFGDGGGLLSSQIVLLNPDANRDTSATIQLRDSSGRPLPVELNGRLVNGELDTLVPARGSKVFRTDGLGAVTSGLVSVSSDNPLAGVVLFGGSGGVAGVGNSTVLDSGFLAPINNNDALQIRVGVAIMNPENRPLRATLRLYASDRRLVATRFNFLIAPLGREARFVDELFPPQTFPDLDLSAFRGLLEISTDGPVAATVLQSRESEFVTLPVIPLDGGQKTLRFAHFGEGGGLFSSEIMLINPNPRLAATANISIKDSQGGPLTVDLNGEPVAGFLSVTVPARAVEVFRTDGLGPLVSGSVTVTSSQPLAGLILFGGVVGVAGVGSSPPLASGFLAPMENNESREIRVGVAMMNLESFPVAATLRLWRSNGALLSTRSSFPIAGNGREAQFIDELFPQLDLSGFDGVLEVTANGTIAATVIQTRPGRFATLPVVPR